MRVTIKLNAPALFEQVPFIKRLRECSRSEDGSVMSLKDAKDWSDRLRSVGIITLELEIMHKLTGFPGIAINAEAPHVQTRTRDLVIHCIESHALDLAIDLLEVYRKHYGMLKS